MSDPAIEAAWSASKAHPTPWTQADVEDIAVAAARQALAPLRELYERWEGADPDTFDIIDLMKEMRPLIYPTTEIPNA